jgi:hypothetical protein
MSQDSDKTENLQLKLTEENSQTLKNLILNTIGNYNFTRLEENYNLKEQVVSGLMVSLHEIIKDSLVIKENLQKFVSSLTSNNKPLFNKASKFKSFGSRANFEQGGGLESFSNSTYSRRSITSDKSKTNNLNKTSFKKNVSIKKELGNKDSAVPVEIVPNKYQIMSPKVCINIGVKGKTEAKPPKATKIELNLADKKENKQEGSDKIEKNEKSDKNEKLDVRNISSSKKPNNKKTNLSNPNPKVLTTTTSNSNHSTNTSSKNSNAKLFTEKAKNLNNSNLSGYRTPKKLVKIEYNNNQESYPTLEDSMRMSSTYKFEPKKKHISGDDTNNSQLVLVEILNEKKEFLNDSAISKKRLTQTRNSGKNVNQINTIENNTYYKTHHNNEISIKFKTKISNKKVKELFNNSINSKIITKIFKFLKTSERKSLRLVSASSYNAFVETEIEDLERLIILKQEALSGPNPLKEISSLKISTFNTVLILSNYTSSSSSNINNYNLSAFFDSFIITLHIFFYLEYFTKSVIEKVNDLELICESQNKNAYSIFNIIIEKITKDRKPYELFKKLVNESKLNFFCVENKSESVPAEFKQYLDLFKTCKRIIDDDLKLVNLVEAEILSSKIDKLKSKFIL